MAITNDTFTVDCPGDFGVLNPEVYGGAPNYFYSWSGPDVGGWEQPTFTTAFVEDATYEITVADQCGNIATFDLFVEIPTADPIVITGEDAISPCPGGDVTISASATGGFQPLEYFWGLDGEGQSIVVSPFTDQTYQVQVQDNCGNVESELVSVTIGDPDPIIIQSLFDHCLNLQQDLVVSGGLPPYNYSFDEEVLDVDEDLITGTQLGTWELTISDNCGAESSVSLTVIGCETVIPNIFTPGNGDDFNDFLFIEGLDAFPGSKLTVYNRWGNKVYEKEGYDNTWDGDDLPEGTYYYVFQRLDGEAQTGYIQLVRE